MASWSRSGHVLVTSWSRVGDLDEGQDGVGAGDWCGAMRRVWQADDQDGVGVRPPQLSV